MEVEIELSVLNLTLAEQKNKRQELAHKISHEIYGSYNSGDTRRSDYIESDKKKKWKTSAWTIGKQLENLRNEESKKAK